MKYRIRFTGDDGHSRYLHNDAANAAVSSFDKIDDVIREVRNLLYCGYRDVSIEGKEEK